MIFVGAHARVCVCVGGHLSFHNNFLISVQALKKLCVTLLSYLLNYLPVILAPYNTLKFCGYIS
jgi:hypothetical protein